LGFRPYKRSKWHRGSLRGKEFRKEKGARDNTTVRRRGAKVEPMPAAID